MKQMNDPVRCKKQRRFLLILPLLTLPFITLMFWALGGGKASQNAALAAEKSGLNLKLPGPRLKEENGLNKLSFYQQAMQQQQKAIDEAKSDPYWHKELPDSPATANRLMFNDYGVDANRSKVYNKLDELKAALNNSKSEPRTNERLSSMDYGRSRYDRSDETGRLREMMQQMKEDRSADPEMQQLNEMLDKLMAIQNPDKAEKGPGLSVNKSLPVKLKIPGADVSLLESGRSLTHTYDTIIRTPDHNAFYSLSDNKTNNDTLSSNAIECTIPETQTLVTGGTVKMSISNDVIIRDISLPSGTLMYGTVSLSNERLKVAVNSIRHSNAILPVSLSVYDMDGQEGIFIPGSISRTVAKESTNKAISGVDATMIDPSIGAQAASAGIEAAKTLIGKKVKLVKVTVKSGYKVLLKDTNEK